MQIYHKHMHLFETQEEHDEAYTRDDSEYVDPWVAYTEETEIVTYNLPRDYEREYLTIEAVDQWGELSLTIPEEVVDSGFVTSISYSVDNGETWATIDAEGSAINLIIDEPSSDNKVMFKGEATQYAGYFEEVESGTVLASYFGSDFDYKVYGNIMSLFYDDDFHGETAFTGGFNCCSLFSGNAHLIDASNLSLPATTLASQCYQHMFSGCTSLTSAPALPAMTLTSYCYTYMFRGCTSLTTAPVLPATTLGQDCYQQMFYGCTSLTTAPVLPATTLVQSCYQQMFYGCTSLTTAPALPAETLAGSCYNNMFYGCTSLTTAPVLPATTLAQSCYNSMFDGCTSLTTAPVLPATTLANYCYYQMFNGCTALTAAPVLPATTMEQYCYAGMFRGCTALTTAPALPATTLAMLCYDTMFQDCTSLTTASALPATTLAPQCYQYMFKGCTALTTAPATLPALTLTTGCYQQMFYGCTALTTAPSLPATTLVQSCYVQMFCNCTSLSKITALFTTTPGNNYTYQWVSNVSATGTFVKSRSATWNVTGANGVPTGWTIERDYLTMEALESGTFTFTIPANVSTTQLTSISYSVDNGTTWVDTQNVSNQAVTITTPTINSGNKVLWKGVGTQTYSGGTVVISNSSRFSSTGRYNVSGNVNSLTSGNNGKYPYLFRDNYKLINADRLLLPAKTLTNSCYQSMFSSCTSLVTAPSLPATTLAQSCYQSMFFYCTSLVTTPSLPARTLANECYMSMFSHCSSLTVTPTLPATTLSFDCYNAFLNGTGLLPDVSNIDFTSPTVVASCGLRGLFTGTPVTDSFLSENLPINDEGRYCLPLTQLPYGCYTSMFQGCTSLITAPELPATSLEYECYANMFNGCTSLTTAPVLPAKTLASYCYDQMFYGCSNLNHIEAYFTTTPSNSYTHSWVYGVAPSGTFVKGADATWNVTGVNGVPSGWTVERLSPLMTMFIDDYPGIPQALDSIEDPESTGANQYRYTGNTITYGGQTCYVWQYQLNAGAPYYLLTTTNNYNTLRNQSFELNGIYTNFISLVAFLASDNSEIYGRNSDQVKYTRLITMESSTLMWIDDFLLPSASDANNTQDQGANQYDYYGNTMTYNGNTYYVWEDADGSGAPAIVLTTTDIFSILRSQSIKTNGVTANFSAFAGALYGDGTMQYSTSSEWGRGLKLLSITENSDAEPIMGMWVDDFPEDAPGELDGEPIEDVMDRAIYDPEGSGANLYVYYGDTMEFNGDDYPVWVLEQVGDQDASGEIGGHKYLLTSTDSYSTLSGESMEEEGYDAEFTSLVARCNEDQSYVMDDDGSLEQKLISVFEY